MKTNTQTGTGGQSAGAAHTLQSLVVPPAALTRQRKPQGLSLRSAIVPCVALCILSLLCQTSYCQSGNKVTDEISEKIKRFRAEQGRPMTMSELENLLSRYQSRLPEDMEQKA